MSRTRTIAKEIDPAALVDRMVQATNTIHENEERMRACRRQFIKAGGPLNVARNKMLHTPSELKELAGFLWYGQPIVITEETMMPSRPSRPLKRFIQYPAKPGPNGMFSKKFLLKRSDDDETLGLTKSREDTLMSSWDAVKPMIAAKIRSDVLDRHSAARRHGEIISEQEMVRELAIETARWRYTLEEWATIFPDAALAGDYDFIRRIVGKWTEPPAIDLRYWVIACFWHGFESVGLGNRVPPLKHWSNKAARELVAFWCAEPISVDAYKALKKKMGRRSEKPKLVTFATYTRRGKEHLLHCER